MVVLRRRLPGRRIFPVSALVAAGGLCYLSVAGSSQAQAVEGAEGTALASWQEREVRFGYAGFTSDYSCDGIEMKLLRLLRMLGAREDARVRAIGCPLSPRHEVAPIISLRLNFHVPESITEREDGGDETFEAIWVQRHIRHHRPRGFEAGDCELVEHVRRYVLPHIEHKIQHEQPSCVPGSLAPGTPDLKLTVLMHLEAGEAKSQTL